MKSTNIKDPKKELLDPRDMMNPNKLSTVCPKCEYHNHLNAINCYNCKFQLIRKLNIGQRFKVNGGTYSYTKKELDFANNYAQKHHKDLLQPTRYNKLERKFEPNPEFIKEYGNPIKNTDVGAAVEADIESGTAEIVEGTPDTDQFIK